VVSPNGGLRESVFERGSNVRKGEYKVKNFWRYGPMNTIDESSKEAIA
jgi:hypothetical protein